MHTVADILAAIDQFAPFASAEGWDNVGLLVGSRESAVNTALVSVDVTPGVVAEAKRRGAQLIIAHHPLIFSPLRTLDEDSSAGKLLAELIRSRISVIAAHTNWDKAAGGVSDALAGQLQLRGISRLAGAEYGSVGTLPQGMTLAALEGFVTKSLRANCRSYGESRRQITRVAVCGGSGMDYCAFARATSAEVFITGDVRHHDALDALATGLCVIDAGHWETERPSISALIGQVEYRLQNTPGMVHYQIKLIESQTVAYA